MSEITLLPMKALKRTKRDDDLQVEQSPAGKVATGKLVELRARNTCNISCDDTSGVQSDRLESVISIIPIENTSANSLP